MADRESYEIRIDGDVSGGRPPVQGAVRRLVDCGTVVDLAYVDGFDRASNRERVRRVR